MQKYKKQITMTSEDMTQLIIKHADSLTDMIGVEQKLERADKNNLVKESRIVCADSRFDL